METQVSTTRASLLRIRRYGLNRIPNTELLIELSQKGAPPCWWVPKKGEYGRERSEAGQSAGTPQVSVGSRWSPLSNSSGRPWTHEATSRCGEHQTTPSSTSARSSSSVSRKTSKRSSCSSRNGWNSSVRCPLSRTVLSSAELSVSRKRDGVDGSLEPVVAARRSPKRGR